MTDHVLQVLTSSYVLTKQQTLELVCYNDAERKDRTIHYWIGVQPAILQQAVITSIVTLTNILATTPPVMVIYHTGIFGRMRIVRMPYVQSY